MPIFTILGVVVQTFFVNKLRLVKLNKVDQFIMAYGGLRGTVTIPNFFIFEKDFQFPWAAS